MELKLEQGDYVPDGAGGFETLEGAHALLARVLFRLTARRGQFPFLPEMGSRLYLLGREKPSARETLALQYVTEALAQEPVDAEEVILTPQPGGTAELQVRLSCQDTGLDVMLEVQV